MSYSRIPHGINGWSLFPRSTALVKSVTATGEVGETRFNCTAVRRSRFEGTVRSESGIRSAVSNNIDGSSIEGSLAQGGGGQRPADGTLSTSRSLSSSSWECERSLMQHELHNASPPQKPSCYEARFTCLLNAFSHLPHSLFFTVSVIIVLWRGKCRLLPREVHSSVTQGERGHRDKSLDNSRTVCEEIPRCLWHD